MKIYVALAVLLAAACAEKKINLEDIEKDTLRAENKVKKESRVEDVKYQTKPDVSQLEYQAPSSQYHAPAGPQPSYISPFNQHSLKYSPSPLQYTQPNKYSGEELAYHHQQNTIPAEQNIQQLRYYNLHQQQSHDKSGQQIAYEQAPPPAPAYQQPEILIGNQVQSIQQKLATEKYTKSALKDTIYIDVPMTQLLSYYPNLNLNSISPTKSSGPSIIHHLATQAAQQISIPVYTPLLSQRQFVSPAKGTYQFHSQYAPKYSAPVMFTTKVSKSPAYAPPKKSVPQSLHSAPIYAPPDQTYSQAKKLITQAYITQAQQPYLQEVVYTAPTALYTHVSPVYTDLYARAPVYVQDNSIHGQGNQYEARPQQYVVPDIVDQQVPKEILQHQVDDSQAYSKVPDEPSSHFVPPQIPAQNFKSHDDITQLVPVSTAEEKGFLTKDQVSPVEPRSLLESYVPSKIIAAQDYERYRERPLQLEGGFLPSKVNFVHNHAKRRVQ